MLFGFILLLCNDVMCNFKSNRNTFSIPSSIDYFRFRPGIEWYRYQVIGNRPLLPCIAGVQRMLRKNYTCMQDITLTSIYCVQKLGLALT